MQKMLSKKVLSEEDRAGNLSTATSNILWCFPSWEGRAKKSRELAHQLTALAFTGDMILVLIMLCLAFEIRFHTSISKTWFDVTPAIFEYAGYIVMAAAFFIGLLIHGDVYSTHNLLRFGMITGRIVRASFIWIGVTLCGTYLLKFEPQVSRVFLIVAWILMPVSLIYWRSIFHSIVTNSSLMAASRRRIAFVGWSEQTALLAANLRGDPESAYQVVGYFEVGNHPKRRRTIVPCLGSIEDFETVLSSVSIDVVMMEGIDSENEQISQVASICEREMAELKLVPNYLQNLVPGFELESIGGVPTMGSGKLPLDRLINRIIKRTMDVVGALICLVILVPIVLLFAGLVYLAAPGPIFYRQRRFGRNGKAFNIVKIRTRRLEGAGVVESPASGDPADLRIGILMRRWNIDDLPQFWNVLAGDMSLVGPRAERPDLIAQFKYEIAQYNARHNVKPGMTGWAQVNGWRGNKALGESVPKDLWYLENWSVLLDLKIMMMTPFGAKSDK
jgi:exopolysaccharide biosynthesis polyprenyl glycosylphosphotransferase